MVGKKLDVMIMPVELRNKDAILNGEVSASLYAKKHIGEICNKNVDQVSFPLGLTPIKVNTVILLDNFRYYIRSAASRGRELVVSSFMPFIADYETERYIKRLEMLVEKASDSRFIYDAVFDKVTAEENVKFYDLYIYKLSETVFSKRQNNPLKRLSENRDIFTGLNVLVQARALTAIHGIFTRRPDGCDLSFIKESKHEGKINLSTNLSNWKKSHADARIIHQSASGLWCQQSGNLLELL